MTNERSTTSRFSTSHNPQTAHVLSLRWNARSLGPDETMCLRTGIVDIATNCSEPLSRLGAQGMSIFDQMISFGNKKLGEGIFEGKTKHAGYIHLHWIGEAVLSATKANTVDEIKDTLQNLHRVLRAESDDTRTHVGVVRTLIAGINSITALAKEQQQGEEKTLKKVKRYLKSWYNDEIAGWKMHYLVNVRDGQVTGFVSFEYLPQTNTVFVGYLAGEMSANELMQLIRKMIEVSQADALSVGKGGGPLNFAFESNEERLIRVSSMIGLGLTPLNYTQPGDGEGLVEQPMKLIAGTLGNSAEKIRFTPVSLEKAVQIIADIYTNSYGLGTRDFNRLMKQVLESYRAEKIGEIQPSNPENTAALVNSAYEEICRTIYAMRE